MAFGRANVGGGKYYGAGSFIPLSSLTTNVDNEFITIYGKQTETYTLACVSNNYIIFRNGSGTTVAIYDKLTFEELAKFNGANGDTCSGIKGVFVDENTGIIYVLATTNSSYSYIYSYNSSFTFLAKSANNGEIIFGYSTNLSKRYHIVNNTFTQNTNVNGDYIKVKNSGIYNCTKTTDTVIIASLIGATIATLTMVGNPALQKNPTYCELKNIIAFAGTTTHLFYSMTDGSLTSSISGYVKASLADGIYDFGDDGYGLYEGDVIKYYNNTYTLIKTWTDLQGWFGYYDNQHKIIIKKVGGYTTTNKDMYGKAHPFGLYVNTKL